MKIIYLLFAFAFTIHNIEEAIWLPKWSQHAKGLHKPVDSNEFIFAVLVITILGIVLTFLQLTIDNWLIKLIYLGYVGMMVVNAIIPHLISTIILRRYSPGLVTALLLNVPIGLYVLIQEITNVHMIPIVISTLIVSIITVILIPVLFWIGKILIQKG